MGWLDSRRQHKAERAVEKRAQAQAAELAAWQAEDDQLRQLVDEARTLRNMLTGCPG
jgi:hypothetical protein